MNAEVLREAAEAMRSDASSLDADRAWHPAVALAVADWLDACAEFIESDPGFTWDGEDHALNVAWAYLGSES